MQLRRHLRRASRKLSLLLSVMILGVGCRAHTPQDSQTKTDLGPAGNQHVASQFASYQTKRAQEKLGCRAQGEGIRVIVTGFGLFTGVDFNISGVVAQTLADARFTPAVLPLDAASDSIGVHGQVSSGKVPATAYGAVATNRTLTIRDQDYEVCILSLDVIWDLAAAIIVREMEEFKPAMILMSGRGGGKAVFEAGAVNHATPFYGFESSGAARADNQPQRDFILPDGPKAVSMTWNGAKLRQATQNLIEALGHTVMSATGPRAENDYICNNVSYVVLVAAQGQEIRLAGDLIRWTPRVAAAPRIGFLHYPSDATNERAEVAQWVRVLATVIDSELRP